MAHRIAGSPVASGRSILGSSLLKSMHNRRNRPYFNPGLCRAWRIHKDDQNCRHQEDRAEEPPGKDARAVVAFAVGKPMSNEPHREDAPESARTVEDVR